MFYYPKLEKTCYQRPHQEAQISQTHQSQWCPATTATSAQPRGDGLFKGREATWATKHLSITDFFGRPLGKRSSRLWKANSLQESPEELNSFDCGSHVGIYAQYDSGTKKYNEVPREWLQKVTLSSLAPMVLLGLKTVRSQIKFYQK